MTYEDLHENDRANYDLTPLQPEQLDELRNLLIAVRKAWVDKVTTPTINAKGYINVNEIESTSSAWDEINNAWEYALIKYGSALLATIPHFDLNAPS